MHRGRLWGLLQEAPSGGSPRSCNSEAQIARFLQETRRTPMSAQVQEYLRGVSSEDWEDWSLSPSAPGGGLRNGPPHGSSTRLDAAVPPGVSAPWRHRVVLHGDDPKSACTEAPCGQAASKAPAAPARTLRCSTPVSAPLSAQPQGLTAGQGCFCTRGASLDLGAPAGSPYHGASGAVLQGSMRAPLQAFARAEFGPVLSQEIGSCSRDGRTTLPDKSSIGSLNIGRRCRPDLRSSEPDRWKSPRPDLARAKGEQSPLATRPRHVYRSLPPCLPGHLLAGLGHDDWQLGAEQRTRAPSLPGAQP